MKKVSIFLLSLVASVGTIYSETFTGQCGDNITWSLNTDDGNLVIEGTGPMYNYSYQDTPWYNKSINRGGWWERIANLIRTITISDGITSIGSYAFSYGSNLTSISIPNSVITIGTSAFEFCSNLSSIEIPNSVTSIGYRAFEYCGLTNVYISNLCTWCSIEEGTELFFNCPSHHLYLNNEEIIDLVIPNGITSIGSGVFSNCFITTVTIPSSVTSIGGGAFSGSNALINVTIEATTPPNVCSSYTCYGEDCYCNGPDFSSHLQNIYIPCGSLEAYNTAEGWSDYVSKIKYKPYPSYAINKNATNGYISTTTTEFTICDEPLVTCTANPNRGCYFVSWSDGNTDNPRTIELTQDTTMEAIFDYMRTGKCGKDSALTWTFDTTTMALEITGAGSLSENYTYGTFIESLTIGNEVTTIGQSAFYGCSNLKNVILGSSVKVLEEYAFYYCSAIETITCYSQRPPTVNNYALYGLDYSTIVYVPADYLNTYKMHDAWGLYDVRPLETPTEIETGEYNIRYIDMSDVELYQENVILHIPVAPTIEGFTFLYWQPVAQNLETGITIQAIYEADEQSTMPAVYTNPTNPSQKLIRNGNIYILTEDKTYTITGAEVK